VWKVISQLGVAVNGFLSTSTDVKV